MSRQRLILTTSDEVNITVERRVAERFVVISNLLQDFGFESDEMIPPDPIPIPNVSCQVMHKVLEWCEQHQTDDPAGETKCSADSHAGYQEMMQIETSMLIELIEASNYLDFKALLDHSFKTAANRIRGKSPEEIRAMFSIQDHSIPLDHAFGSSVSPETLTLLPYTSTFHATLAGALHVRQLLQMKLASELAVPIASFGYSPWLVKRKIDRRTYRANDFWRPGPEASVAGLYLSTEHIPYPLTEPGQVIPKRIIFQTRAADQGWASDGGHGTFHNSHTWFEASILRPLTEKGKTADQPPALEDDDALSKPWENAESAREALKEKGWDFVNTHNGDITWRVCNNITARREYRNYRLEWKRGVDTEVEDVMAVGKGEGFLDLLRPGCIVVLWARAEQQAWVHEVEAATVEIEFELP